MSAAQKAFEAQMFAKNHYKKLLTAKSSLRHFKESGRSNTQSISKTVTPLDRYQYNSTNAKICSKLTEIYKTPDTALRRYRRSKDKYSRSMNEQTIRQEHRSISRTNVEIFQRILCAKSTVGEDWKEREKRLKKYNKLARKKVQNNDESLFEAYQHLMTKSRGHSARSTRSRSAARPSSGSSRSQPVETL